MMIQCRNKRPCLLKGVGFLVIVCTFVLWNTQAMAQDSAFTPEPSSLLASEFDRLQRTLEKSLVREDITLQHLEQQLDQIQRAEENLTLEMGLYKVQLSIYTDLLLKATRVKELVNMRGTTRIILEHVKMQLEELREKQQIFEQSRLQIERYYVLNQKQLHDLETELQEMSKEDLDIDLLFVHLHRTEASLSQKRKLLQDLQRKYAELIDKLQLFHQELSTVLQELHNQIEQRRYLQLFERTAVPWEKISLKAIREELEQLIAHVYALGIIERWWGRFTPYRKVFLRTVFIPFLGGLLLIQILLIRLRRIVSRLRDTMSHDRLPWSTLLGDLLDRSLLLFGATLYIYLFARQQDLYTSLVLFQVVVSVLMIWVSSQWFLDMLTYRRQIPQETSSELWVSFIRSLIIALRSMSMAFIVLKWSLGQTSTLVSLGRMLVGLGFLIWFLIVKKQFFSFPEITLPGQVFSGNMSKILILRGGFTVFGGGLLLEIVGYEQLAAHWYRAWAMTLIVLIWAYMFFCVLREWHHYIHEQIRDKHDRDKSVPLRYRLQGFLLPFAWFLWGVLLILGLLLAWGPRWLIFPAIERILTYQLPLGKGNIRLVEILFASLILLLTRIVTYIWRYTLQEKFLLRSSLGKGIGFSLTTFSVYLLWIVGILWVLNVLGVSMTSLTVIFGALGIGIGFGLQDIVSNFISGLILLFERPIEVGDVIELDGGWGTVKKISGRATVVQTFENSTLIIPNAQILSHRLTNWTFRDPRVRRTIRIGVAYGSDVDMVKQTLSEIAGQHPRVFPDPAPMILFMDFADSALRFELRVWTLLDHGLTTETDLRSEIARVFREKNIIIPFPQHDVHLIPNPNNRQDDT